MKKNFTILFAGLVLLSACKKDVLKQEETEPVVPPVTGVIDAPEVPFVNGFIFNTTKDVKLNVSLRTNEDLPLAGVVVNVYLPETGDASEPVFKGVTDKSGMLQGKVTIAASVSKLIIDPAYIGLMRNAQANVSADNTVNAIIGGINGFGGDVVAENVVPEPSSKTTASYKSSGYQSLGLLATSFVYPGSYTSSNAFVNTSTYPKSLGRPAYLETTGDNISASFLSYVNTSLPEGKPLTTSHPQYLAANTVSTLDITAQTDVYLTFVSEGAANLNSLAYYTYPTGNPPASGVSLIPILNIGIEKVTHVFPNASAKGSGGGLNSGDKVKLGNFAKGTSIAFILFQNGWTGTDVDASKTKFYSTEKYNTNSNKQSVVLYDNDSKKFVIGFEDISRSASSDNDFNDLVVSAASSVTGAIATANVSTTDTAVDTDGDGVLDVNDAFPKDATKAFVSYYPSQTTYGSIAFEDNWPKKGDYDMNDLVINYRYTYEANAQNNVVSLKADYIMAAAGTNGYKHGFGVQLPVNASAVSSVTGQKAISNYITMAGNGVEAGQAKAVIIPFDNHYALVPGGADPLTLNTRGDKSKVNTTPVNITINFTSPVTMSSLAASSFNPFLITNLNRGREVHLAGYKPTDKADTKVFDTEDDATVPSQNRYYTTLDGHPWALMFNSQFAYPMESRTVDKTYMMYNPWATSGGNRFADWYSSIVSGYRNNSNVYNK